MKSLISCIIFIIVFDPNEELMPVNAVWPHTQCCYAPRFVDDNCEGTVKY